MATRGSEAEKTPIASHLLGLYHININVSNLERSRAFYELLGFHVVDEFAQAGEADLDRGLGYAYTDCRAIFMAIGRNKFETVLDIVEWNVPKSEPKENRLHDIGAPRIALRVKNVDRVVTLLEAQGVKFIAETQLLTFLKRKARFACCKDPDGMVIEFVELLDKSL
ncbi:MAG: VOC family protein [Beijerinckiaceae bacterium]|nr:VOC family protein [Beijerinckiaceae bacterium]